MVATDYKTYAIMNIILNRGGKPSSVLKLYSEPTASRSSLGEPGPSGGGRRSLGGRRVGAWGWRGGAGTGWAGRASLGAPASRAPILAGRTLEHNEKATEKFMEKAVEQGLSVSNVQLLTKDCECRARGRGPPSWELSPHFPTVSSPQ